MATYLHIVRCYCILLTGLPEDYLRIGILCTYMHFVRALHIFCDWVDSKSVGLWELDWVDSKSVVIWESNWNAPYPSSFNGWKEFIEELYFNEITANAAHAKSWNGISTEHFRKLWCIDMESVQKTLNAKTQREVSTDNPKPTRKFGTCDRMLRHRCISEFFFKIISLRWIQLENHREVTHAAKYLLLISFFVCCSY